MTTAIPVLRLDAARRADGGFDPTFTDALRAALHDPGFVQLTDYGAAPGQVDELFATLNTFFDLPAEDRMALDNRDSPHFRGYTRLGHEVTDGRPDLREQIDFGPELPARPRDEWDAPFRLLEGPNRWPDDTVPEMRPRVMAWAALLERVGAELTRALAHGLGLPADQFDDAFAGEPHWFGKLIRYVGRDSDGPDAQGVGPHADWGFLTLLLQDRVCPTPPAAPAAVPGVHPTPPAAPAAVPGVHPTPPAAPAAVPGVLPTPPAAVPRVGGLQALPPGADDWVDVPPLPGALVVNVGEMLEVATHGHLTATRHRVLPCAPGRTRQSVGFFWSPRLDAVLDQVPLTPELAARAPGVHETERNALLPRFGDNAVKGWIRSHPEVAQRHHPDLVAVAASGRAVEQSRNV